MAVSDTYSEIWLVGSKSCVLGEIVSPGNVTHDENNNVPVVFRPWDGNREAADWPHLKVTPPDIPLEILPWAQASVAKRRRVVLYGLPQDHGDDAAGADMALPLSPTVGLPLKFSLHHRETLFGFERFSKEAVLPLVNGADVAPFIADDYTSWIRMQHEMAVFVVEQAADNALIIWNGNHVHAFWFPGILRNKASIARKPFDISAVLHSPFVGQQEPNRMPAEYQQLYRSALLSMGGGRVRWSMPDNSSVETFIRAYEESIGTRPTTIPSVSPSLFNTPESGAAFIEHVASIASTFTFDDPSLGNREGFAF